MAKFVSNYPGTLVLPDADHTEITCGAEFSLTKEDLANAGIKEWIDAGWIIEAGKVKVAAPAEDTASLKAALAAAEGTVTALTAELDAEREKRAGAEARVAELDAALADANAALEAATKPQT